MIQVRSLSFGGFRRVCSALSRIAADPERIPQLDLPRIKRTLDSLGVSADGDLTVRQLVIAGIDFANLNSARLLSLAADFPEVAEAIVLGGSDLKAEDLESLPAAEFLRILLGVIEASRQDGLFEEMSRFFATVAPGPLRELLAIKRASPAG